MGKGIKNDKCMDKGIKINVQVIGELNDKEWQENGEGKWKEMIGKFRNELTEMTDGWGTNKDEMTGE